MNKSPSAYGGIAAAMVFGVGLLIVGFSLPSEKHDQAMSMIWLGVAALVLGAVVLAVTLAPTPAGKAFFGTVGALICSGVLASHAACNEFTGKAVYHEHQGHSSTSEPVTRESSPVKFRQATNFLWGMSGFCLIIAAAGFMFYRAFDADDYG